MRRVAKYSFGIFTKDISNEDVAWDSVVREVDSWLEWKGKIKEIEGQQYVQFTDGRQAKLFYMSEECDIGRRITWELLEPVDNGEFCTSISLVETIDRIFLYSELSAGSSADIVKPVFFDARCPKVIRSIIDLDFPWSVGQTKIATTPIRLIGEKGGGELVGKIKDTSRVLPLVVISEYDGFFVHPILPGLIARNLAGLAVVISINDQASWEVTKRIGAAFSCFNGAIRLYWPKFSMEEDFKKHPLWTATRLMTGTSNTEVAAKKFITLIRKKILGLSTLVIKRPTAIDSISNYCFSKKTDELRKKAEESNDYKALYELADEDNEKLKSKIINYKEQIQGLRADLLNSRTMYDYVVAGGTDEIVPEDEKQIETIQEAIDKSSKQFADCLIFGDDVAAGVKSVLPNAGPPDKVFSYIRSLAQMGKELQKGSLGKNYLEWLRDKNIDAIAEKEQTLKNRGEVKKRTWHDGQQKRPFTYHLRPVDSVQPDKCVRIYFDWDEKFKKVVVAWVGRHP